MKNIILGKHLTLVGDKHQRTCYTPEKEFRVNFRFDFQRGCWLATLARLAGAAGYQKCADFFLVNNNEDRLHQALLHQLAKRDYGPAVAQQRVRKLRALIA